MPLAEGFGDDSWRIRRWTQQLDRDERSGGVCCARYPNQVNGARSSLPVLAHWSLQVLRELDKSA